MNYRVIRDCRISGASARVGDIIFLDDKTANELMSIGRVVPNTEMSNSSDRQVKEVESREAKGEVAQKVKPRTSRGRSKSSR